MGFAAFLFAGLLGIPQDAGYIEDLQNKDPDVRRAAAELCGRKGIKTAIPYLIERIKDEVERVRSASVDSLLLLTGKKEFGADYRKWRDWWDQEGFKEVPIPGVSRPMVREMLSAEVIKLRAEIHRLREELQREFDKTNRRMKQDVKDAKAESEKMNSGMKQDVKDAEAKIKAISLVLAAVAALFVAIMFYFVGHVSSRLKEWKDFTKRAEEYIEKGQEINQRTDKVIDELEAKKADILEFAKKQRDEVQSEIDRYADLLQENSEHQMREEVMALRQKAEKELEQTLGEVSAQVEQELRRRARMQREGMEKDYDMLRAKFLQEVASHTMYLEARFYSIHGKPEEALKQYKKLVAVNPEHYVAWSDLGDTYRDLLRYDEALEAYEKALAMAPNDSGILYNIAATHARLKQKDRMIDALKQAIANDGEYKDEALNDAAFRDYWNDAEFKDVAEG